MATYRMVEVPGAPVRTRWAIERVVPGEKPETLPFRGSKPAAKAEMIRLYEYYLPAPPMRDSTS